MPTCCAAISSRHSRCMWRWTSSWPGSVKGHFPSCAALPAPTHVLTAWYVCVSCDNAACATFWARVRARIAGPLRQHLELSCRPKGSAPAQHSGLEFVPETLRACAIFWARFRARNVARLRHILGAISCPKRGQPAPLSGLDFVPEKWAGCTTFWARFRARKVGLISCPKCGTHVWPH